jgi:hypothetical protein
MLLKREACGDVYLSAFRAMRMSSSHTHKAVIAAGVAAVALALAGCGDNGTTAGSTGATAKVNSPPATASTGSTGGAQTKSGSGGSTPATATEPDVVPVDVRLKNGKFAPSTPSAFHVPTNFLIIVSVKSDGAGPYMLSVQGPSIAQTFKIASNDQQNISIDALSSGESAKLMLGGQTVKIKADAEPGP